jgi:hypothetical protein
MRRSSGASLAAAPPDKVRKTRRLKLDSAFAFSARLHAPVGQDLGDGGNARVELLAHQPRGVDVGGGRMLVGQAVVLRLGGLAAERAHQRGEVHLRGLLRMIAANDGDQARIERVAAHPGPLFAGNLVHRGLHHAGAAGHGFHCVAQYRRRQSPVSWVGPTGQRRGDGT